MEKKLTARKDHFCSACNEPIRKGSLYMFGQERFAKYDKQDKQVGITYASWRLHINCPVTPWYEVEQQEVSLEDISDCSPDPTKIKESEHYINNYQDDLPF